MSYHLIIPEFGKPGIPTIINGVLTEKFDPKNPLPPMAGYSWTKTRDPNRVYPSELWLVTKERRFSFDYMQFWDGYIVSKKFKRLLDAHPHPEYKEVRLQVIGWKGKPVTNKDYYFIDIPLANQVNGVDRGGTLLEWDADLLRLTGNTEDAIKASGKYLGLTRLHDQLVLKPNIRFDVFRLYDMIIHDLFCNDIFKTHLKSEVGTVRYIPLPNVKGYDARFRKY